MSEPNVVAVIVAYHPDLALLHRVIEAAAAMVSGIVVVNNDSGDWSSNLKSAGISIHVPGRNIGLAAAYNYGAERARQEGATHLLLLDQDSIPTPGMVSKLLAPYSRSEPIAATGPLWKDSRTGEVAGFAESFGAVRVPVQGAVVDVDFLISSGSLVGLSALSAIGPFDETLFIDHVDTDWTLRARAKGFSLLGVADAMLEHSIGEASLELPWTRRRLFLYPPERTYYLVRNSIRLWFRPYATWRWRLFDVFRLSRLLLLYMIFAPDRALRIKAIAQGVRDAVRPTIAARPA